MKFSSIPSFVFASTGASLVLHGAAFALLSALQVISINPIEQKQLKNIPIEVTLKTVTHEHVQLAESSESPLLASHVPDLATPKPVKLVKAVQPDRFRQTKSKRPTTRTIEKPLPARNSAKQLKELNKTTIAKRVIKEQPLVHKLPETLMSGQQTSQKFASSGTLAASTLAVNKLSTASTSSKPVVQEGLKSGVNSAVKGKPSFQSTNNLKSGYAISTTLPPLLKSRQPDYPEEARWEERMGKTVLKFRISNEGRVLEPQVSRSSGHRDLDSAAINAIQRWRFKTSDNTAVNHWFQYAFNFRLN